MKIFIDFEFTGLHQYTTPVSLGVVNENDEKFYAEFTDFEREQVDEEIKIIVLDKLILKNNGIQKNSFDKNLISIKSSTNRIVGALETWLLSKTNDGEEIEVWSDVLAYDWVLFCQLWGGAMEIPEFINYIPHDIATLMKVKGVDPDVDREKFADMDGDWKKHNALWDAIVIKKCFEKLKMKQGAVNW